jgi:hypothetical protein
MKINISITRKDYGEFNKYYFTNKLLKKPTWLILLLSFFIAFLQTIKYKFSIFYFLLNFALISLIIFLVYWLYTVLIGKFAEFLPSKNGFVLGAKTIIVDDEQITEESIDSIMSLKWSRVKSIDETSNLILIFIDNVFSFIIPKRDFDSSKQEREFIEFVKSKLVGEWK